MVKKERYRSQGRSIFGALGDLYAFIYCMLVSQALVEMPIFGGVLFMCARVAAAFYGTFVKERSAFLPPRMQGWRRTMLVLLLLINLCVVVIYPAQLDNPRLWIVFVVVLMMFLRDSAMNRLVRLSVSGGMEEKRFVLLIVLLQLLNLAAMAAVFLYNLPGGEGLFMLGGYALCSGMTLYGQLKERVHQRGMTQAQPDQVQEARQAVEGANAYTTYEKLSALILVALEVTLVLLYTFLAASAQKMLGYMILAVVCTLLAREAAEEVSRLKAERKRLRAEKKELEEAKAAEAQKRASEKTETGDKEKETAEPEQAGAAEQQAEGSGKGGAED